MRTVCTAVWNKYDYVTFSALIAPAWRIPRIEILGDSFCRVSACFSIPFFKSLAEFSQPGDTKNVCRYRSDPADCGDDEGERCRVRKSPGRNVNPKGKYAVVIAKFGPAGHEFEILAYFEILVESTQFFKHGFFNDYEATAG